MKNQVILIKRHEVLIEKSAKFSGALSGVLTLYVDHFKIEKQSNYSLLSKSELEIIKIIEIVTECTKNIDMEAEQISWKKCLSRMEGLLLNFKKILYSTDTDEMEDLQKKWSLKDEERKKASEWIEERERVIEAGKSCLIELQEICRGSDVSDFTKSVCKAVQNRIEVGESCLAAWTDWINHRMDLASYE